jgi:hypothetical protein
MFCNPKKSRKILIQSQENTVPTIPVQKTQFVHPSHPNPNQSHIFPSSQVSTALIPLKSQREERVIGILRCQRIQNQVTHADHMQNSALSMDPFMTWPPSRASGTRLGAWKL